MNDEISVILCDGRGLESIAAKGDLIVMQISRTEVEKGLVGDAVDRLMVLSTGVGYTRRFRNSVSLLFSGYDSDEREIHEIPECVTFVRTLTREWPFWFHFLEKEGDSVAILLRLLFDVDVVRSEGAVGVSIVDEKQVTRVLNQLFDGMNILYEMHGYSELENIAMTSEVNQCMDRFFS